MPHVKKIAVVLYARAIEPCLDLWVNRLGFEKTAEVPEGDALGFVILAKDGLEVMYQTLASVAKDVPAMARRPAGKANLFIEVDSIDDVEKALAGLKLVLPRRTTFYGATEVGVQDAAGNVIVFAEMTG
jgi:hypothetical protein